MKLKLESDFVRCWFLNNDSGQGSVWKIASMR